MIINTLKIKKDSIIFILTSLFINILNAQVIDSTIFSFKKFPEKGFTISMQDQGKAKAYFKTKASYYLTQKDTANYIHCMVGLAYIEQARGRYNNAFDIIWNTLPKGKHINNKAPVLKLYRQLGLLYGNYGKDSIALHYLQEGLDIAKAYYSQPKTNSNKLSNSYFSIANQYIKMKDYNIALQYLDSCYIVNSSNKKQFYVNALYGLIHTEKGDFIKAEKYLNGIVTYFENNALGYQAKVNMFIGNLKHAIGQQDSAMFYYQKSLKAIDSLTVHPEIKPEVMEKLALLYFAKNNKTEAFKYMQGAKFMSDSLFNTQSRQNNALFEIKNKYQEDIYKQQELIAAQNKLLETKDKASFRLKLLIAALLIISFITLITYKLKTQMKKLQYEQSIINEKNDAILEIKNKELTANALQIIEKEHSVKELLVAIKNIDPKKHQELSSKYRKSNKKLWEDFNLRFKQINNKFYESLLKLHPHLTQTDLKLCALIKLNFDSKEIAEILAISTHGVHTARSRVRKKLNLNRKDSLTNYIANILPDR